MDIVQPLFLHRLGALARENLGLKLVALVVSVALFSYVHGAGEVQRIVDLPLVVTLPATGVGAPVLLTSLPDKVRLTVRGASSLVGSMRDDDVGVIQLDLRDGHRRSVRLGASRVHLPAGAVFVSLVPDALELHWDVTVARTLPIRASLVGSPSPRLRVDPLAVEVEPERVRVTGPSLYADSLTAVHTDLLDVSGLPQGRYERRVPLETLRVELSYDEAPIAARVTFDVVPIVSERRIQDVPVVLMGPVRGSLRPAMVDVTLRGDPVEIERLNPSQVVVAAEITDPQALLHGAVSARVHVRPLPEGCEVAGVTPGEVLVVPSH